MTACDPRAEDKRLSLRFKDMNVVLGQDFSQFVIPQIVNFSWFKISSDLLHTDPDVYRYASKFISKLFLTNGVSERHVKLIHEYNNIATKGESQKLTSLYRDIGQ